MNNRLLFTSFAAATTLWASAFYSGGFNYAVVGENEVEIARPTDTSEDGGYKDVIDFPASVTYGGKTYTVVGIGERAFQYAEFVGMATMPNSYRYVGPWAFHSAEGVAVRIGLNVDSLGVGAFAYNKLSNLLCNDDNAKYAAIYPRDVPEGETIFGGVIATKDKQTIIAYPGNKKVNGSYVTNYTVPSIVKHIGPHAFHGAPRLKSITFHEGVEDIGEYACYECLEMTRVEIPGNTKLNYAAFAACETNLRTIILHEGVTEIAPYCFFDAENCTSLQLPSTLQYIGDYALCYLENISTITLPEGMRMLGQGAFSNCTRLSTVNFNDQCEVVGPQCFASCDALQTIDLNKVKYLGKLAFNGCSNLSNVTLNNVEYMERAPFYNCRALQTISLPETLLHMDPVTFMLCTNLTDLTIPASVTYVGGGTAAGASSLKEIKVEDGSQYYTTIDGVLYDKALATLVAIPSGWENTELVLPATVTFIDEQAGHWCNLTKLEALGVKRIEKSAFLQSEALAEVTLGAYCDTIGETAFGGCPAIVKVTSLNTVPPAVGNGVFDDAVYNAATLYVPVGAKDAYQDHATWQRFTNVEEIEVEQPAIPGDLNGDGNVDVEDVNIIINLILEAITPDQLNGNPDLNGDGATDIGDVNDLINLILNQ